MKCMQARKVPSAQAGRVLDTKKSRVDSPFAAGPALATAMAPGPMPEEKKMPRGPEGRRAFGSLLYATVESGQHQVRSDFVAAQSSRMRRKSENRAQSGRPAYPYSTLSL